MKPPPLSFVKAFDADDAVARLAAHGDEAKLLAGAQSLVPMLAFRLARPSVLIDVGRISELRYVQLDDDGALRVGATTTHRALERLPDGLREAGHRLVAEVAPWIGHLPIRARGTIGGSLAHADPSAEWCLLVVLLDAEIAVLGPGGRRTVAAERFLQGFLATDLAADEMVVEIRLPATPPTAAVAEVARRHGDFALGIAGAVVELDADGICRSARIVIGAVDEVPLRARVAEDALVGHRLGPDTCEEAARTAARDLEPATDATLSGGYRRRLAAAMVRRALTRAVARHEEAGRWTTNGSS